MIIVRALLYVICLLSIGWSLLFFGAPMVIKKSIISYTNGALNASNISLSPGLDITIGKLDFKGNKIGIPIDGFSRSIKISWAFFGNKPFIVADMGPSVVKDVLATDSITIQTRNFKNFDWQNIHIELMAESLGLQSNGAVGDLTMKGELNSDLSRIYNLNFDLQTLNMTNKIFPWSVDFINGFIEELDLKNPLGSNLTGRFEANNISFGQPVSVVQKVVGTINSNDTSKNIKLDLADIQLKDFGGSVEQLKIDGEFGNNGAVTNLNLDFFNSKLMNGLGDFSTISAEISRVADNQYYGAVNGDVTKLDLYIDDNFVGTLPNSYFSVDVDINSQLPQLAANSKINFKTLDAPIVGSAAVDLIYNYSGDAFQCFDSACKISSVTYEYTVGINNERVQGRSICDSVLCDFNTLSHFIETSNTIEIFKLLSEVGILTPLSSIYLYSSISTGDKIGDGHKLKY